MRRLIGKVSHYNWKYQGKTNHDHLQTKQSKNYLWWSTKQIFFLKMYKMKMTKKQNKKNIIFVISPSFNSFTYFFHIVNVYFISTLNGLALYSSNTPIKLFWLYFERDTEKDRVERNFERRNTGSTQVSPSLSFPLLPTDLHSSAGSLSCTKPNIPASTGAAEVRTPHFLTLSLSSPSSLSSVWCCNCQQLHWPQTSA